ncbi:MAG: 50S ribosomal protein L10 [Candidatus Pelagibacterales bacterium]|jgi:large subunit ribosomal protein L10
MNRLQKQNFVENIKSIISEYSLILVFHYRGMSVNEISELRVKSFETGANIKVTNNRLIKIALDGSEKSAMSEFFEGPTAIAYSNDPVELTKLLANFSKTNEKLAIIGGIMNKEILTVEKIIELSKLPSLDETRAKLIGLLNAPAQRITGLVAAPAGKVANVINAFSKSN